MKESIMKQAGYVKGLLEGTSFENESQQKLISSVVELLSQLSDRVDTLDEIMTDLNDYVESIDDSLSELEDEYDDEDFFDDEDFDGIVDIVEGCDPKMPLHITRFFPAGNMRDVSPTKLDTLYAFYERAKQRLENVFLGNV